MKNFLSALLAVFWVVFLWNFWDKGVYALGFNAAIFGFLFLGLFIWVLFKKVAYVKSDLTWIIPLGLIVLSFALYDNPFLKGSSLLVFPVLFVIFYNQAFLKDKKTTIWNSQFILKIIERFFSFFTELGRSATSYLNLIIPVKKEKKGVIVRVIGGLLLFLLLALTVFIPLLSSADAVFAGKVQALYDFFTHIFSLPLI